MSRLVKVRRYRRSIGKSCLHCNRSATVTAVRKDGPGPVLPVRYCVEHFEEAVRRCAA